MLGQVNRPGRYPIETAGMRMTDLLANAGGVATTGGDQLVLTGTRNGKPFRMEIDLPGVFSADQSRAQDVLWVDRAPLVYIYGEVPRPGPTRLERGIRVHRKTAGGKVQVVQAAMDDGVKDGDMVYVKEGRF